MAINQADGGLVNGGLVVKPVAFSQVRRAELSQLRSGQ